MGGNANLQPRNIHINKDDEKRGKRGGFSSQKTRELLIFLRHLCLYSSKCCGGEAV